ncbi:hypothetical protein [Chondromyces apiculatus]|uniref:Uncharacterized protein n=1 Tax=Chondromyces apiculatus DSM 436 TaxID=1192034 RepID=A0A017T1D2_9BACT|nr:hypothetical protein [Chondromyces apiculatus]EYF02650.1 Hypothetical protein CAP_6680 [Chondromyces apiculatus DSM 436]
MNTSELVDWIARWFEPTFGEAEAQAKFGVMNDPKALMARATPHEPRFRDVVFERINHPADTLSGVQLTLAQPETIPWAEVVARYGEPQLLGVPWDHWGSAVMHGFAVHEKGRSGQLVLAIRGKPGATATVERVILRRFPPRGDGRAR